MTRSLTSLLEARRAVPALFAVAVLGLALRLWIAAATKGSNDIVTWSQFAADIAVHGVEWMYRNVPGFNHPPLMGWWALIAWRLSLLLGWTFDFSFKLLPIAGEVGSALLLFSIWKRRRGAAMGAAALALFAVNLDSTLVSAFHGNTDSLCAMFALLACYLLEEREAPFFAGLALGAALNVKLIPVLLIPVLLARTQSRSALVRGLLGMSIGVVPFIPMLLTSWDGFRHNAIDYNSNFDNWGLPYFVLRAEGAGPQLQGWAAFIRPKFESSGRYLILGTIVAVCALARSTKKGDAYQLAAVALALFLVMTPGFGVQYTVYLVPVLFAASLHWGAAYSWAAGVFILLIYHAFWTGSYPPFSRFVGPFPVPQATVGLLPWAMLVAFVAVSVTALFRAARPPVLK